MRVLTVLDAYKLGGAETLIAQLGRVAHTADLELDVISLHGPSPERSKLEPLLLEAGLLPRYLGIRRTVDPAGFGRLVRYIRQTRPDVVHAHLEMAMTLALPAAAMSRTPAVGTFHHVHRPLSGRALERERIAVEIAGRSQAAIFVSQASLDSFAERYRPGRPIPPTWRVVHNGIDVSQFTPPATDVPDPLPTDLGLAGYRVVTVLAALRDFKGIVYAIRAWQEVIGRHPDARLLLVGTGTEEEALRQEVSRLGLADSVVFAGMRTDVAEILRGSELTVLPSIYGENLPTVLMEAGACGRPVVASHVGGISDIVADGETGLLVPSCDHVAVAASINQLLDNPALARRLGDAGRRRVERLFDARGWARSLHEVYEDAVQTKSRRPVGAAA